MGPSRPVGRSRQVGAVAAARLTTGRPFPQVGRRQHVQTGLRIGVPRLAPAHGLVVGGQYLCAPRVPGSQPCGMRLTEWAVGWFLGSGHGPAGPRSRSYPVGAAEGNSDEGPSVTGASGPGAAWSPAWSPADGPAASPADGPAIVPSGVPPGAGE